MKHTSILGMYGFGDTGITRGVKILGPLDVSIIDLMTLKIIKRLALPGRTFDSPECSVMTMTRFGRTVLIATARPVGLVLFDIASRTFSTPPPLPLCPG